MPKSPKFILEKIKQLVCHRNAPIVFVGIVFLFMAAVIIRKFYILQIIEHDRYLEYAINQQTSDISVQAKRGDIVDRNGNELAISATAYLVSMNPSKFKEENDREYIADSLADILSLDREALYEKVQKDVSYIVLARGIDKDVADEVKSFVSENELTEAFTVTEIAKRYYPHGNLLSTVLGFVGSDNQGLEGIEYMYDDYLKGTNGKIITSNNALGTAVPFEYEQYVSASDGDTVMLTIDLEMQYFLEKHIENTRIEHNVQNRVAACVMDVKTGEILAMSTKPDYDPNNPFTINDEILLETLSQYLDEQGQATEEYISKYNEYVAELRTNKFVVDQYDPGSTFKIFTAAMAIEEDLPIINETFYCSGSIQKGVITYHCAKSTQHGPEDFREAIANSCNVAFIQVAEKIGIERFYNYVTIFGLREKTGVGLPGEVAGIHHELSTMSEYNLYSSSFGQTFKITGMQLIAGVSSIANGGTYMQPYIIKKITDSEGNIVLENKPTEVRKTVSKETAERLWSYLEYTVEKGRTGYLAGYRIAGKTGTSQKVSGGTYENEKKIASFICFAPADDPQICVLVIVDEPDSEQVYGSYIAAPLGRDIMGDCLKYLNIEPDYGDGTTVATVKVGDYVGYDSSDARQSLLDKGLAATVIGGEGLVTYQLPNADTKLPSGSTVILYTNDETPEKKTTVPDVVGKTASEANELLVEAGLNIKVVGSNINYPDVVAKKQSPSAGETVDKTTVVTVTFE